MAVKPSLALIPSGVKQNKVYSVLPSNGDGDFTFSRSGNATRVNKDGFIEEVGSGIPRLNYPLIEGEVSGCPSLLLEPSRTNLITYSEDFSQSSWIKSSNGTGSLPVVTTDNTTSPDGNVSANKVVLDMNGGTSSSNWSFISFVYTSTATTYTMTCYLKGVNGGEEIFFDFDTGNDNLITLTTDWVRYEFTKTVTTTSTRYIRIGLRGGSTTDDTASFHIWGAQFEQGSYPTSYIPTNGSQVTRSAETCNNAGNSNVFNDSEGVLMAEMAWINNDLDVNADLSLSDNSVSNRVLITQTTTKNQIEMFFRGTGATISQFFTLNDTSNFNKFAIKYKSTDFAFYINGFKLFESNSVATVSNLFDLSFDNPSGGGTRNFYGNTKQIQYYNTALTDAELEKLTSYDSFRDMAIAGQYKTY